MQKQRTALGFGSEMPPRQEHVSIYFIQKGMTENDAVFFFQQHQMAHWQTPKGKQIRNWKAVAADWIWELQQARKSRIRHRSR